MPERRRALLLGCLLLLVGSPVFSGYDPAAVAAYQSDVAFLDSRLGIFRVSGGRVQPIVNDFGTFQAADFTTDGDSIYVTLLLRGKAGDAFSRVRRWNGKGATTGEWFGTVGGVAASVAIDSAKQLGYCSDSRTGEIYQFKLGTPGVRFTSLLRLRDVGSIGPMVLDAARRRLIVADTQKGRIYSVTLDDRKYSVLLDSGTIIKPLALAIDAVSGRLYVADAAKRRIWVGSLVAAKFTVTTFGDSSFREPVGVAVSRSGSRLSIWVADRGARALVQLSEGGQKIGGVTP